MAIYFIRLIAACLVTLTLISCASTRNSIIGRQADPVDPNAAFDLAEYLFHSKLKVNTGTASYTENYYKKNEPSSVAARYEYKYQRNGETINVQSVGLEGIANQYTISENMINDVRPTMGDSRSFQRYARMGDTYLDAEFTLVNIKESCVLSAFLEKFNLSSATGSIELSDDAYNNVIKVRCISEFTDRANDRGNYRWNIYYAKGIGPVFKDGNWENYLGQIYSIYDYVTN